MSGKATGWMSPLDARASLRRRIRTQKAANAAAIRRLSVVKGYLS
jgi:hypothetical protein